MKALFSPVLVVYNLSENHKAPEKTRARLDRGNMFVCIRDFVIMKTQEKKCKNNYSSLLWKCKKKNFAMTLTNGYSGIY